MPIPTPPTPTPKTASAPQPTTPSLRTRLRRRPDRGTYEPESIRAVIDAASLCDVAFVADGAPRIIPTFYARLGDELILHGAVANRMLRALAAGAEACVAITCLDGIVLARSAFRHSMNYRSVVIYGSARTIVDPEEKERAFRALIDKLAPGRWSEVRAPSEAELAQTLVLALPIHEASAKSRTGPPGDAPDDLARRCWAGVVPVRTVLGAPIAAPELPGDVALPSYLAT